MKIWIKTETHSEGKFLVVRRDGTTPDWPHFVLGARDPAVPSALESYSYMAQAMNFDPAYVASIRELAQDFRRYEKDHGKGDPDAPPHRTDDPVVLAMMRRELSVRRLLAALRVIADGRGDAQMIARQVISGGDLDRTQP